MSVPLISRQKGNVLRPGLDGGVYASGSDILSNGDDNLLRVDAADSRIKLTAETVRRVVGASGGVPFTGDCGPLGG